MSDGLSDSTQGCRAPLGARPASRARAGQGGAVVAQGKGHITSFDEIKEELACLLRAK